MASRSNLASSTSSKRNKYSIRALRISSARVIFNTFAFLLISFNRESSSAIEIGFIGTPPFDVRSDIRPPFFVSHQLCKESDRAMPLSGSHFRRRRVFRILTLLDCERVPAFFHKHSFDIYGPVF